MSKSRIIPLDHRGPSKGPLANRRWAFFAALAVAGLLALAYFDGGEEPIHPISQQIALPTGSGASE
jgi:hypothetical protein